MVVKRAKDKTHYIVDINGNPIHYPSVSKILSAAFPSPFNPRNPGNKKDRKKCLQRGIAVHEAIQNNLQNKPLHIPLANAAYYYAALGEIEKIEEIGLIEESVYHNTHQYAGTLDLIAKMDGEWALVDWKSTRKPRKASQMQRDFHQAAAYVGAVNWLYGWQIRKAKIICLLPSEESQVWEIEGDRLDSYWKRFQKAAREYHRVKALVR